MNSFGTILVRGGLVAVLAIGYLAVTGTATAAAPGQEAAKAAGVQVAPHGAYAGTATCLTCHEDRGAALKKGPHSHAFRAGTPIAPTGCQACHADTKAAMGCEGCHGPGKDARRRRRGQDEDPPLRVDVGEGRQRDLRELPLPAAKHALWAGSQHDQRNVGCTTCHSIHAREGRQAAQGGERDRAVRDLPPRRSSTSSSSSTTCRCARAS